MINFSKLLIIFEMNPTVYESYIELQKAGRELFWSIIKALKIHSLADRLTKFIAFINDNCD